MSQRSLEDKWEEDEEMPKVEAWIQIDVFESIEGEYIKGYEDKKYNKMKYIWKKAIITRKDKTVETYETAGINGTTNMDFKMKDKEEGDMVKLLRLEDKPTDKGNPLQVYKTFHLKKENANGDGD